MLQPNDKTVVVLGAQWGDEGKGKIVDVLAGQAHGVVRFQGGANAGHTLWVNGEKTVVHNLPSGIVRKGVFNFVGPYVLCDPGVIVEELSIANDVGSLVMLDTRAPVVLSIHKALDKARERASGADAIGTTGRGIGPCYEDWTARRGVTLGDLVSADRVRKALRERHCFDERAALIALHGGEPPTFDETVDEIMKYAEHIVPHLVDVTAHLHELHQKGATLIFEGAQGVMLDVLHGRPYCTSSFCTPGAISACFGIHRFDRVIGVTKAYATRVGAGPFPSERDDNMLTWLREHGQEYGATTGRPRRCGVLDLPALQFACRMAGITELVVTKLDVLTHMSTVHAVAAYFFGRDCEKCISSGTTLTAELLSQVAAAERFVEGWDYLDQTATSFDQLPETTKTFLRLIEERTSVPVTGVSLSPERNAMVWR